MMSTGPDGPGTDRVVQRFVPDERFCPARSTSATHQRTAKTVTVNIMGEDKVYTVLHLEFSSKRKRNGVILETEDGKIVLYTKGLTTSSRSVCRRACRPMRRLR